MSDQFEDQKKDKKKNKGGGPQFPFGGPKLPDMKPFGGWKFSIVYIIVLIIGMSLFNYVFLNRVNPTIDFSEFKARISSGEIKRVELTDSYFTGYTTLSRQETSRSILRTPYLPSTSQEKGYRTVAINDPEILKLLDEKNGA
jgi:cell division protease FtsH